MNGLRDDILASLEEQNTNDQVSPEPDTAPLDEVSGEQDESGSPAADTTQPSAEVEQSLEAPQHWDAAHKEAFKGLPKPVQELWLKRDKDIEATITRKTQEVAEQRKAVEPLLGAMKQHDGYLRSIGVTPDMAFSTLINTERLLRTGTPEQKASAIAKLISDYGIPTDQIGAVSQPQNTNMQPQLPPDYHQLRETVDSMVSSQLHEQVNSFSGAKDAQGNLLRPHFEVVRGEMAKYMAVQGMTLEKAYKLAVAADESLQSQISAQAQLKAKADDEAKARDNAAKAKRANSINIKPNGGNETAAKVLPLRDDIMQMAREMSLQ
jgi:hypothetical protein